MSFGALSGLKLTLLASPPFAYEPRKIVVCSMSLLGLIRDLNGYVIEVHLCDWGHQIHETF